ncbi:NADP-dependent oxidoreductase [Kribbella antibiotica]|uniref:NADP-dependent oxidoreductase n=2 Tax=Kribbella antibiotica TaxID=190195 RepID=A0A4R4ZC40_9ACTN|nr:NADP-dependent oxidoreductase [Kribbella antibiotica]
MMALRAHARGGAEELVYERAPVPNAGPGDVLLAVHACAITVAELGWDETWTHRDGTDRTPIVPGHEVSGTVVKADSKRFAVGDQVYGLIDFDRDGAAAQYVAVRQENLSFKPRTASHEQAAAMTLSALTAWQAFNDHAHLKAGETTLVTGAAGGVGVYAVQIAAALGAHVSAMGRPVHEQFVKDLGAKYYIPYTGGPIDSSLSGFDVVLDAAGAGDSDALYSTLKPGGRLITLAAPPSARRADAHKVKAQFFIVRPDYEQLAHLAQMTDDGTMRPVVGRSLPLVEGRKAFEHSSGRRVPGKTVLTVR